MKKKQNILSTIGLFLGTAMILFACGALVYIDTAQRASQKINAEIVEKFFETIPAVEEGLLYDRSDVSMPVIQLENTDIIGVIKVPVLSVTRPICASWNKVEVNHIPSRLSGSIYDRTLIIGGTDAEGQLDFFEDICVGDEVLFNDASGAEYRYILENIEVTEKFDAVKASSSDDDLTLFAKKSYSSRYTVLHLKLK